MFSLKAFVTDTLNKMAGKEPEYKVRQYALGWFEKGVIDEDSLEELETTLSSKALEEENTDVQNEEATEDISSENMVIDASPDNPSIPEPDEDLDDSFVKDSEKQEYESADPFLENCCAPDPDEDKSSDPFEETNSSEEKQSDPFEEEPSDSLKSDELINEW